MHVGGRRLVLHFALGDLPPVEVEVAEENIPTLLGKTGEPQLRLTGRSNSAKPGGEGLAKKFK